MITAERLKVLLAYDPLSGHFTWINRRRACRFGEVAGSTRTNGYRRIGLDNHMYLAHRLARLYMTGEWPAHEIDHKDGDRSNNRFANLRAASAAENHQNRAKRSDNSSGLVGATNVRGRWQAAIVVKGVRHYLGAFATAVEAHSAYLAAKSRLHEFQPSPRSL